MKRLALLVFSCVVSACEVQGQMGAQTGPPPPPPAPIAVAVAPAAEVSVGATTEASTEATPEATTAPEEVTAATEPPDPIYEEQSAMPGPGYVWVGGYWGWTGADWAWYSGRWWVQPAGQVYVEPYYERVGPNVVYVRGYWGPRDAPRRYYGGERIRFAPAVRPANYRPGERARAERSPGLAPGSRSASLYERGTGTQRPLPRDTRPSHPVAPRETVAETPGPGRERGPTEKEDTSKATEPRAHGPAEREAAAHGGPVSTRGYDIQKSPAPGPAPTGAPHAGPGGAPHAAPPGAPGASHAAPPGAPAPAPAAGAHPAPAGSARHPGRGGHHPDEPPPEKKQ